MQMFLVHVNTCNGSFTLEYATEHDASVAIDIFEKVNEVVAEKDRFHGWTTCIENGTDPVPCPYLDF